MNRRPQGFAARVLLVSSHGKPPFLVKIPIGVRTLAAIGQWEQMSRLMTLIFGQDSSYADF